MTRPYRSRFGDPRGFALVTALILLAVLTLVGLMAIRGTGLEMRMSANTSMRTEAFDSSETSRLVLGPLVDVHVFNRGWPVAIGGDVADSIFDYPMPTGLSVTKVGSPAKPRDWYLSNTERDNDANYVFYPDTLVADAAYKRDITVSSASAVTVAGSLAVYKLRTALNPGAGSAMVAGYEGTGKAAAASGGNIFFYIRSQGQDPGQESDAVTGAVFRDVIRN
ncbi:MAG: pilus assembly PilX N-terminal domain-containing protein [Nevskiales bacterium]|nr:pilus assembly PilX N-terminal domain-containing protein [Nevskiales bacterium]